MANKPDTARDDGGTAPGAGETSTPAPSFPSIGQDDSQHATYLGDFKTREEAEAAFKDLSSKVSDFDNWRQESTEREQRLQDTINRLISSGGAAASAGEHRQQVTQQDDLSIRIAELADPVEKPDEFKRGIADMIKTAVTGAVTQSTQQQTQQSQRANALQQFQSQFSTKYSDISKYAIVRDAALNQEAAAIQARGGDPYAAWAADPDGFVDRVARTTRGMLKDMGITPGAASKDENEDDNGRGAEPNRTGGIPGGGGPTNGRGDRAPQTTSFVDELKEMQLKSGFF